MKDLIDRQTAIEALADMHCKSDEDGYVWIIRSDAWARIDALPSAQPEHKTGKWIERNPQNSPDCRLIECSECGNAYIVGYNIDYDEWIDKRNFCMKCGADMRGGDK